MEQYFNIDKIRVTDQVDIIAMYLMGDAKLRWRTGTKKDLNVGCPRIET
jgi:hypothetical protein